jgi:hypothetical protein
LETRAGSASESAATSDVVRKTLLDDAEMFERMAQSEEKKNRHPNVLTAVHRHQRRKT